MIFTNVGIQIFRNQSIHVSLVLMIPEIYYGLKVVFFPKKIIVNLRGVIYLSIAC